jgi:bacillithiol system protein YtxJ
LLQAFLPVLHPAARLDVRQLPLMPAAVSKVNEIIKVLNFVCMHWIHLTDEEQLKQIVSKSQNRPQVIFKHSTRCSISSVALQRLQKMSQPSDIDFYFLDLLSYRTVSNKIVQAFSVPHESPQVLVIRDGKCVYEESHMGISMNDIVEHAHAA